MCTPKAPKAPPPDKAKPLKVLLSRDRFDKLGGQYTNPSANYLLPPRAQGAGVSTSAGTGISPGLNVQR